MNPWDLETLKLTVKPNPGAIKAHCETLSKALQGLKYESIRDPPGAVKAHHQTLSNQLQSCESTRGHPVAIKINSRVVNLWELTQEPWILTLKPFQRNARVVNPWEIILKLWTHPEAISMQR